MVLGGGAVSYERGTPVGVSARPARLWERTADEAQEEAAGQKGKAGGAAIAGLLLLLCYNMGSTKPTYSTERHPSDTKRRFK